MLLGMLQEKVPLFVLCSCYVSANVFVSRCGKNFTMDLQTIIAENSIDLNAVMADAAEQASEERSVRGVAAVKKSFGRFSQTIMLTVEELKDARAAADEIKDRLEQLNGGLTTVEALDALGKNGDYACEALARQVRSDLAEGGVNLPSEKDNSTEA